MPSTARRRGRNRRLRGQPSPPLILFTDRSLGRKDVPTAIRNLGYKLFTIWDVFPQEYDNRSVSDPQWLWHSARRGWVCLTYDQLRKPPAVPRELRASGAEVFRFAQALESADQQIEAFKINRYRIEQWATRRGGPYRRVIRARTVEDDGIP